MRNPQYVKFHQMLNDCVRDNIYVIDRFTTVLHNPNTLYQDASHLQEMYHLYDHIDILSVIVPLPKYNLEQIVKCKICFPD